MFLIGASGWVRTTVGRCPSDLQSDAIDHSATDACMYLDIDLLRAPSIQTGNLKDLLALSPLRLSYCVAGGQLLS